MIATPDLPETAAPTVTPQAGSTPVTESDVGWIYRTLLGRSPENAHVARSQAAAHPSVEALCRSVMDSPEFRTQWRKVEVGEATALTAHAADVSAPDADVIRSFAAYSGPGTPGFVTDFLGTKTRVGVVKSLASQDGDVEGYPIPGNFHGGADEWAGTLRSVLEADPEREYVAAELGAGWGPWLAASAAGCRHRGIRRLKLVGLEAAAGHVAYMRQHFLDNGLDPDAHTILHGASATEDGYAEFPDLNDDSADYGATLSLADPLLQRVVSGTATRVKAYSIATLLEPYRRVDLVHIDIQGSEGEVVAASRGVLKAKVRRLVIGTHGRAIEQRLLEDLSADGWVCETDEPCRYASRPGAVYLALDGCQVWRNDAV